MHDYGLVKYRLWQDIAEKELEMAISNALTPLLEKVANLNCLVEFYDKHIRNILDEQAPCRIKRVKIRSKPVWFHDNRRKVRKQKQHAESNWRMSTYS